MLFITFELCVRRTVTATASSSSVHGDLDSNGFSISVMRLALQIQKLAPCTQPSVLLRGGLQRAALVLLVCERAREDLIQQHQMDARPLRTKYYYNS